MTIPTTATEMWDPYDSRVSGNIAITLTTYFHSDEAFQDPVTGQTVNNLTIQSPTENLNFFAGYDYSGNPIVRTSFLNGADASGSVPDQVTQMTVVGNAVSSRNTFGQIVDEPTPAEAAGQPVMNLLGDMTGVSVTDNIVTNISADNTPQSLSAATTATTSLHPVPMRSLLSSGSSAKIQQIGPDTLVVTETVQGNDNEKPSKQTKKFHKEAKKWILIDLTTEAEESDGPRHVKHVNVMAFSKIKWSQNEEKNAERRSKRSTNQVLPLSSPGQTFEVANSGLAIGPSHQDKLISCDALPPDDPNYCGSGGGGGGGSGGGGTTWDAGPDIAQCFFLNGYMFAHEPNGSPDLQFGGYSEKNIWGNVHPNGTNIVFQHGLLSSATTWCDMESYLRTQIRIGWEARFSLHSLATYEDQAVDLRSRIAQTRGGSGPIIFIGHSNGGIVSRQLAHNVGGDPSLIGGVLTIDSPHGGAPIAGIGRLVAAFAFAPLAVPAGCNQIVHNLCRVMWGGGPLTYVAAVLGAPLAFNGSAPVAAELRPTSSYRATLNSPAEVFPRASIQSQSWDKWTEWRLYGDMHGAPYAGAMGGRGWVKFIDHEYHYAIDCAVIGALGGLWWPAAWYIASGCAKLAAQVKGYDLVFKRLTVGGDHGDGIVPLASQKYPNLSAGRQFTIGDGDSHVGVLRGTDRSGSQIVNALNLVFGVPHR
ncbi:MAG: esterase/lipase family protein [Gemmatimonadaceae bacterium]